jgi:hypothetical protein
VHVRVPDSQSVDEFRYDFSFVLIVRDSPAFIFIVTCAGKSDTII